MTTDSDKVSMTSLGGYSLDVLASLQRITFLQLQDCHTITNGNRHHFFTGFEKISIPSVSDVGEG